MRPTGSHPTDLFPDARAQAMARRVIDADARDGHEASIGPDILDRHRKANPTRLLLSADVARTRPRGQTPWISSMFIGGFLQ
jgi:hypothetical protein